MPTVKSRINITADSATESVLRRIAKRDRMPVASKAAELLVLALDLEEDISLATIADLRARRAFKFVSHDAAWK